MLISIVIPTYDEGEIYDTLTRLLVQSVFKKYEKNIEIVIADYDHDIKNLTYSGWREFKDDFPSINCKYYNLDRKGIAYQRHMGIMKSTGEVIVNFDADAYFSTVTGIEDLVVPILQNKCVLTCCDNLMNLNEITDPSILKNENMLIITNALHILNQIQRVGLIVCLEPGMCFTRYAYDYVNGFNDVKQWEAIFMTPRMIYSFGFGAKQHVDSVQVISSPRRAVAAAKKGIIDAYLNYDNAFRLVNGNLKSFL